MTIGMMRTMDDWRSSSAIDIFISAIANYNIMTFDHVKKMQNDGVVRTRASFCSQPATIA